MKNNLLTTQWYSIVVLNFHHRNNLFNTKRPQIYPGKISAHLFPLVLAYYF